MKRFKRPTRKQKIIIAIVLAIAVTAGAWYLTRQDSAIEQPTEPTYSQLTGLEVDQDVAKRPILGVMIENSPSARPQTGLSSAGIVFESVTEGGITRYLALYQDEYPEKLGPIRSVRPYFVDWLMGLDASVAHVGGSAEALVLLDKRQGKTLTQFSYPDAYYRSNDRPAPHNMYAKTADLVNLQKELDHRTSTMTPFPRSGDSPSANPTTDSISINYSSPNFTAQFVYDNQSNIYKRLLATKPDIDAINDKQITVKNVVVLKMKSSVNAIGSGEGALYKDGIVIPITWQQTSPEARLKLLDDNNQEVSLNRGKTWFAVLPSSGTIKE